MFSIPWNAAPTMSAWHAIRFLSRQTTWRIGSTPACARAIAMATFEACACAAVLSVAFIASTQPAISAMRARNASWAASVD